MTHFVFFYPKYAAQSNVLLTSAASTLVAMLGILLLFSFYCIVLGKFVENILANVWSLWSCTACRSSLQLYLDLSVSLQNWWDCCIFCLKAQFYSSGHWVRVSSCLRSKRSPTSRTKYQAVRRSFPIRDARKMGREQKGQGTGKGEGKEGNACPQTPLFWKTPTNFHGWFHSVIDGLSMGKPIINYRM